MNHLNASNGIDTIIAGLFTNYIIKHFKLDMSYMTMVLPVTMTIITTIKSEIDISHFNRLLKSITIIHIIFLIAIYVIYNNWVSIFLFFNKKKEKINAEQNEIEYITINVYDKKWINIMIDYIKMYPHYFNLKCNIDVGNKQFIGEFMNPRQFITENNAGTYFLEEAKRISETANQEIIFFDQLFKYNGFIIWKYCTSKVDIPNKNNNDSESNKDYSSSSEMKYRYLEINIRKDQIDDPRKYLLKIEEIINKSKQTNKILLYHVMVNVAKDRYADSLVEWNSTIYYEDIEKSIDEMKIELIDSFFHPEKDSIWKEVRTVHENPEYYNKLGQPAAFSCLLYGLPGSGKSALAYRIAKVLGRHLITVDLAQLLTLSKKDIYKIFREPIVDNKKVKPKTCVYVLDEIDIAILNLFVRQSRIDAIKKTMETPEFITGEDGNITIKNKKEIDLANNSFCLDDLKCILQGSVPIEGSIIIAMTNHYEKIKDTCPALFREGRLKPIKLGYLDNKSMNELSNYYFNSDLNIELPKIMNIPTSEIIKSAIKNKDNFGKFKNEIKDKIKELS